MAIENPEDKEWLLGKLGENLEYFRLTTWKRDLGAGCVAGVLQYPRDVDMFCSQTLPHHLSQLSLSGYTVETIIGNHPRGAFYARVNRSVWAVNESYNDRILLLGQETLVNEIGNMIYAMPIVQSDEVGSFQKAHESSVHTSKIKIARKTLIATLADLPEAYDVAWNDEGYDLFARINTSVYLQENRDTGLLVMGENTPLSPLLPILNKQLGVELSQPY